MKKVCSVSRRRRAGGRQGAATPRTPSKPCIELNRPRNPGLEWALFSAEGIHGKGEEADLRRLWLPGIALEVGRKSRDERGRALRGYGERAGEGVWCEPAAAGQTKSGPCREGRAGVADEWREYHDVSTSWGSGPGRASRIRTPIPHCGQSRRLMPVSWR